MTPIWAKAAFVLLVVGWYVIRFPYARRSRRAAVAHTARGLGEMARLSVSFTGLILLPAVYVASGFPRSAEYTFQPIQAWFGILVAFLALVMFRLTHRALGRYWSVSLDIREQHRLITEGVYRRLRHPMYTAFWLWAVAQALLLPNWIAGFAGLVGFGVLFFGRIGIEERMMLENFGDEYRAYKARTDRIIPLIY